MLCVVTVTRVASSFPVARRSHDCRASPLLLSVPIVSVMYLRPKHRPFLARNPPGRSSLSLSSVVLPRRGARPRPRRCGARLQPRSPRAVAVSPRPLLVARSRWRCWFLERPVSALPSSPSTSVACTAASRALDGTKTNLRVRVVAWRSHQLAAVIEAMSVPLCPGAAHAAVGDDVSITSETLRWASLVHLAILSQSQSSVGRRRYERRRKRRSGSSQRFEDEVQGQIANQDFEEEYYEEEEYDAEDVN
ncbi:uncharacterized protein [Lolium perenne]|uniref:uncharacterized protein isoform X1 n=1 Tax=Lolium perenne TaxID=4522 RepID=UPI003A99E5F5